jgi:hypothetical protein
MKISFVIANENQTLNGIKLCFSPRAEQHVYLFHKAAVMGARQAFDL